MAAAYSQNSPYTGTQTWGKFLDVWPGITIPADVSDALYAIDSIYNLRPDLLAYDIYQDSALWWVFAVRNPDVLTDPVFSFTTGTVIYVPNRSVIQTIVGT
jgi:hypothetical protein